MCDTKSNWLHSNINYLKGFIKIFYRLDTFPARCVALLDGKTNALQILFEPPAGELAETPWATAMHLAKECYRQSNLF